MLIIHQNRVYGCKARRVRTTFVLHPGFNWKPLWSLSPWPKFHLLLELFID